MEHLTNIAFIVGAGLLRSILGWLENSLKDGSISMLEWRKLGETVVRVGLIGAIVAYFPGVNISGMQAALVAIGGDMALLTVKKLAPKQKKR